MGCIHVLSETVANQIAAGEVVERPASVVKEMLENSLDAGATRIKISVEAGGKKLIQITDNGCGMVRDDAMLAFERHATSKIKNAEDLLSVATLGFRGEALPSIASVSRLHLETRASEDAAGTVIEINGGKIARVDEAGLPAGTSITVRDLFFNVPARKKFLKSESTELSHIASLVTHYALAHPDKHFELHSATNAILVAPPVSGHSERVYQAFGKETLDQLIPVASRQALDRVGLPQPPPWRRREHEDDEGTQAASTPGEMRIHGFISKPEIQKLNRNSIFVFVNGRLIRDRLIQHALTEAYRNIIPPTVYPVVLLFLELPAGEVDVNVHPSKTEVRFRQQTVMHDFVRDSVRAALMKARPVPQFMTEIRAHATAGQALSPGALTPGTEWEPSSGTVPGAGSQKPEAEGSFALHAPPPPPTSARFQFEGGIAVEANAAIPVARGLENASVAIPAAPPRVPDSIPAHGSAPALDLALALTALHLVTGLALALAARGSEVLRRLLLALADLLASIPATLLALLLLALLRPGWTSLVLALALGGWIPYARLALNRLDQLRQDPSLLQVGLLGAGPWHRFRRHLLPRLWPVLGAQAAVGLGAVILVEGGLSFLGVGLPPQQASWGTMLASGRAFLLVSPWGLLWPSLGMVAVLLGAGSLREAAE